MNITSQQGDTYLDSVDGALTSRGLRPARFTVVDTDELADGGVTALPGAVLAWPAGHSGLDPERFPHGAVATWTARQGWQAAALRSDGTGDTPVRLPLTVLGEPNRVVDVLARVLLGRAVPHSAVREATGSPESYRVPSGAGPADPALTALRAEIWGHFHSHPRGRSPHGYFASRLSFPLARGGQGWSERGVQVDYGDDGTVITDLDGYLDVLERIADQCPAIEGPLVLTL
ncbi:hypothetical protein ACFC58_41395 [Kitasatospora purpeofusca]|uniref:hypothetical protein n=1 Tax=Kitasatospora purpeofusca TaxID=67352 RepID=UPI0035D88F6C